MRLIDAAAAKRTYTAYLFDAKEDFERVNDIFDCIHRGRCTGGAWALCA